MYEQTSIFFSFVYDDFVLSQSDLLMKQISYLSLFSTMILLLSYKSNFGLYYLIRNTYENVCCLSLNLFLTYDEQSHWEKSRV